MGPGIGIFVNVMHGAPQLIPLFIPVWLGVTYWTARTVYHRSTKNRARELASLADRLAALARELVPARHALPGSARSLPP